MAQHDYVIDNQSAPSARADINSALSAIVTQNSGATAPATTYADMFWYDTATNQLKKRNEANSAWITLGTIDESTSKFTPNSALTTAGIDPATLVVAAEGIASNNNDTTLPTSAAVKAYTDSAITAQAPTAVAATTAGAVGSFLWGTFASTSTLAYGATVAGSSVKAGSMTPGGADSESGTRSGTWKFLGYQAGGTQRYTLFVRIS
jgi:hypothetical protein